MFDFDAGKLVVIGAVALVVIGPKELPRVLRQVGQTVSKVRRMAADFQSQFMDAMREAEMADVKEEMKKIADSAKIDVAFDPVRDIRNQIGGVIAGETTPSAAPSLAELDAQPSATDLPGLEALPSAGDGGLLAAGIAPDADGPTPPDPRLSHAVATRSEMEPAETAIGEATLDDVRNALARELGSKERTGGEHRSKEHGGELLGTELLGTERLGEERSIHAQPVNESAA